MNNINTFKNYLLNSFAVSDMEFPDGDGFVAAYEGGAVSDGLGSPPALVLLVIAVFPSCHHCRQALSSSSPPGHLVVATSALPL